MQRRLVPRRQALRIRHWPAFVVESGAEGSASAASANIAHLSGVAAAAASHQLSIRIARKSLCVRSVDASRLRIGS